MRTFSACSVLAIYLLIPLSTSAFSGNISTSSISARINDDRTIAGLSSLQVNTALSRAAQMKAEDMAAKGYFAHNSPEGITPWYWFDKVGYEYEEAGENLALRFSSTENLVHAWMHSPSHRANILNENFREVGIGIAQGMRQGTSTVFVVALFGSTPTPQ